MHPYREIISAVFIKISYFSSLDYGQARLLVAAVLSAARRFDPLRPFAHSPKQKDRLAAVSPKSDQVF
jgi:hypothetical protein